ncbi:MAG: hypothetical protein WAV76_10890 [Bacteroidota bacterium]
MKNPLLQIVSNILTLLDSVVEPAGENSIDVLLSSTTAEKLGVPEEARLQISQDSSTDTVEKSFSTDEESNRNNKSNTARILGYNAETFEKLSTLIQNRGTFVEQYARHLYLKQEGIDSAVKNNFKPLNGLGRVMSMREQTISYLLCNVQYTAFSDERKEGVVETAVNEFTGLPVEDIRSVLHWVEFVQTSKPIVERKTTAQIYQGLLRSSQRVIEVELQQFRQSLQRRLKRDFIRVREYYSSLVKEIEGKIQRKGLEGKERAAEVQRIEAIQIELRKKLIDQRERYAVRIAVQWPNAMRIYLDVLVIVYEIQRRQRTREILLIWNPIKKGFEDLGCDRCGSDIKSFWMCDEVLHILCEQCSVCPKCGKNICRACHPKTCPRCHQ